MYTSLTSFTLLFLTTPYYSALDHFNLLPPIPLVYRDPPLPQVGILATRNYDTESGFDFERPYSTRDILQTRAEGLGKQDPFTKTVGFSQQATGASPQA